VLFIYLFICDISYDTVGSSVYIKSSDRCISEYRRSQTYAVLSYAISDARNVRNKAKIEIVTEDKTSGGAALLRLIKIQCAVG
jgi:hypothetical protein